MFSMRGKQMTLAPGRRWAVVAAALLCLVTHAPSSAQESGNPAHAVAVAPHGQMFARIHVPDVAGLAGAAAVGAIEKSHLRPELGGREFSGQPPGRVSRTLPSAPESVAWGTQVRYWLSLGLEPKTTNVPDVRGFAEAAAVGAIQKSHLRPELGGRELSGQPPGRVSRTLPSAPESVAGGTQVRYWLSLGSEPKTNVPDVTGKTPDQATAILRTTGLVVGDPLFELSLSQPGRVSRQYPLAKSRLPPGTIVSLWLPYAWFSLSSLAVISCLVLVLAVGGVIAHVRWKQRLAYTRRMVSMRASIQRKDEADPVHSVPLGRPLISMRTRLEPGGLLFQHPVVIERREIQHD
ncbi:MAG: PASTA domain-containing protein [Rhodanobacter sp.]